MLCLGPWVDLLENIRESEQENKEKNKNSSHEFGVSVSIVDCDTIEADTFANPRETTPTL